MIMQRIVIRFVIVIALCTLVSGYAWAASSKEGRLARVDHALAEMYKKWEAYLAQGGGAAFTPSNPLLRVHEGWVLIDAVAFDDVNTLRAALEALGMREAVVHGRIVSGRMFIPAIEDMAALASLQFARPAYSTTNVEQVTSQD